VTQVKKAILPVILAVLIPVIIKFGFNPKLAATGIVMGVVLGACIGCGLNALIFKKDRKDEVADKK
jgi:Na+-driven multidrug efflux pump